MVALLANSDKQNGMQDADDNDSTRVVADVSGPSSGPVHPGTCTIAPGDVLGDRYRIIEHIGKGGMGDVVLAEHIAIGRKVAIKTLHGDFLKDPEIARRFLHEARTASQIRHPNVVDITDFGHTDRGAPFFVMELLEGEDLRALLAREQTLAWPRVCAIVLQICRALTAAHAHGVIHRDMKPDNVYIIHNPDTTEEVVKVLDFGIAKTTTPANATAASDSHEVTRTGVLLGTPHYMSPEQAQDEPLDPRSDIYAVGVLLYRMTTGTVPFRGKSFMKVLSQHLGSPPPPPRTLAPDLDPTHEQIILQCLAKQPEDRYPSAEALAAALAATLDTTQTAIRATPTPAPKRRRLLVAGTLVLGAGLLVLADAWRPATPTPPVTTPVATPATVQEPPSEPPQSPRRTRICTRPRPRTRLRILDQRRASQRTSTRTRYADQQPVHQTRKI